MMMMIMMRGRKAEFRKIRDSMCIVMDAKDADSMGQMPFNEAEQCGRVEMPKAKCTKTGQCLDELFGEHIRLRLIRQMEEEWRQVQVG